MNVLYDWKENRFVIMADYLVAVSEGIVHVSTPSGMWQERPNYILLGDL